MADSNIQAIYPLTPMQEGILFHSLESPAAGTYFNHFTCRLEGPLDTDRFERAWRDAYSRHPALRTLFTWEKRDRPLQIARGPNEGHITIEEPLGGAHRDPAVTAKALGSAVQKVLNALSLMGPEELVTDRWSKFRKIGAFKDSSGG